MNNAFEFTFMPESYPSQHLLSLPPPLSFFTPTLLLHLSTLPSSSSYLHYSSSSELSLISPLLSLLPLPLRQTADRKRCGIRPELPEPNTYCITVYYPGLAQVAACSCICIFMSSKLGHWRAPPHLPPPKLSIHFAGLSEKDTVEVSIKG